MRRRQMMHLTAGHPTEQAHAQPRAKRRAGPHYVSLRAGLACQPNGRLAPAIECLKRQGGDGGGGGLKTRLLRPMATAIQQTKSLTITATSTSSSPSPPPYCCLVIDRTKTSSPISTSEKTNTFESSQQQQKSTAAMLLTRQAAPQMLATSGVEPNQAAPPAASSSFNQHQQAWHQSPNSTNRDQHPAQSTADDEMEKIKKVSRDFAWTWDESCWSPSTRECQINRNGDKLEVCFHPLGSESTAACRGSKPLVRNGNYYYWELTVSEKCYGTSVMFGLCTLRQNLHLLDYCNIIGLDECGWSLSHKGLIWHNGKNRQFTPAFPRDQPITIGLLLNTTRGELSYFKDGKNLGVAFSGLNDIEDDLYPAVGSTAKNTKIRITGSYCGFVSLMERSCFSILKDHSHYREQLLDYLNRYQLPRSLIEDLLQVAELNGIPFAIKTTNHQEQIEDDNINDNNNNTDRITVTQT